MRKCIRCDVDMVEDLDVRTTERGDKLRVTRPGTSGLLGKNYLGDVKAAVCPVCGHLETYLADLEKVRRYWGGKG